MQHTGSARPVTEQALIRPQHFAQNELGEKKQPKKQGEIQVPLQHFISDANEVPRITQPDL